MGHAYRDLVAGYLYRVYGPAGLDVYTEVPVGKTILGKNRHLDILVRHQTTQQALAIECKYQKVSGTTEEKIPYALQDLAAMWIPGCLAYAGEGWSAGVLHTLAADKLAVYCETTETQNEPSDVTRELDHVVAAVFGLWDTVLPIHRRLPLPRKSPMRSSHEPQPKRGVKQEKNNV